MLQTPVITSPALKEWAITIEALGNGTQIFVLRKGGIHEETRHFQIQSNQFFLFPAYEHQKKELLKSEYHTKLDHIVKTYSCNKDEVPIGYLAHLQEDIEIKNEEQLYSLEEDHICTNQFAFERYKWKRKDPLHMLVLRVYQLKQPLLIPVKGEYLGCKSWFQLPISLHETSAKPVLEDQIFLQKVNTVKEKLLRCELKG